MFGKRGDDKIKAWMSYLKKDGLERPVASIPFDLISTDGITDEVVDFLARMLTLAATSGMEAAEEAVDGFMNDPDFASDIDDEIKERMAAMPSSDALDSIRSTDEILLSVTTLLHLLDLWQGGQVELLQPAYTLRKLILDPGSSRWVSDDVDLHLPDYPGIALSKPEDMAVSELLKLGVGVLLPLSDEPFDLMLHWKGRMLRARIRSARRKGSLTRFSLPVSGECDVMVLCDDDSVYLLKPEDFKGRRGFTIRHLPTKNGRTKGCNFHADFVVSEKRVNEVLDVGLPDA